MRKGPSRKHRGVSRRIDSYTVAVHATWLPSNRPPSISIDIAAATDKAAAAGRAAAEPYRRKAAAEEVAAVALEVVARIGAPTDTDAVVHKPVAAQIEAAAIRRKHTGTKVAGASMAVAPMDAAAGSAAVRDLQSYSCLRRTSPDAAKAKDPGTAMSVAAGNASTEAG